MRARSTSLILLSLSAHPLPAMQNPLVGSADRAAGAEIYRTRCAGCHGRDGTGGAEAQDLTTGTFRRASTDTDLYRIISSGIPGTSMTGLNLTSREIWQLVTYVRSLGVGHASSKAKGNPRAGARVFQQAGCLECHSISGEGGHSGPDLADIGSRRSLAALRESLRTPDAEVLPEHWRIVARTRSGEVVSGVRLNEDTYTYQIREPDGRLRVLPKRELVAHEIVRKSEMPSFEGRIGDSELEDLLAYLAGLSGAAKEGESR